MILWKLRHPMHFPQKSPIISGSFAKRDLQIKTSNAFSPQGCMAPHVSMLYHTALHSNVRTYRWYCVVNRVASRLWRTCDKSMVQSGENALDALSCRSLFAKEPLIIGLFCGKWPPKIRQSGENALDALICRSLFAKEPLIIGLYRSSCVYALPHCTI